MITWYHYCHWKQVVDNNTINAHLVVEMEVGAVMFLLQHLPPLMGIWREMEGSVKCKRLALCRVTQHLTCHKGLIRGHPRP